MFGLRVQPGNELPGRDAVADVHGPLHDAAADAERKRDVVLRLDLARELDIVRQLARLHRDDVDRAADVRRRRFSLTACGQSGKDDGGHRRPRSDPCSQS